MISLDAMRAARRSLAEDAVNVDGSACPPAEQLYDAAAGALPPAEAASVVDHLGGCAACAADWLVVVAAGAPGDEAPRVSDHAARALRALLPILGLVALAAGIALVMQPPPELVFRDGAPREAPLPVQELPRETFTLRWPAGTGTYAVLVSDEAGRPLHREVGLKSPELTVPARAFDGLSSGAAVVWQVEETLPDGSIRRSAVRRSVLR
jgi:hypothetical protein